MIPIEVEILIGLATGLVVGITGASGGAKETLIDLLEEGTLPAEFAGMVKEIPLMDSVFMLHLGVDKALPEVLKTSSTYFYGSYDIEGQVKQARQGVYHEGAAGFVVHVPKIKLTGANPVGRYAMTIYTICPERLSGGGVNGVIPAAYRTAKKV